MSRHLTKGERAVLWGEHHNRLAFHCPGCADTHVMSVADSGRENDNRPRWTWNGSLDRPTLQPSLLVRTGAAVDPTIVWEEGDPPLVCHSFITDGRIQFLTDSTHALAGQTVDIPEWPR